MLSIHVGLKVSRLLLYGHIDKYVSYGMKRGARAVSSRFVEVAREKLSASISAKNGHESGNLSDSIFNRSANTGLMGYARWDVQVDTRRAPYALWAEYGSNAIDGLPYSKGGNRDYSKSKFKGHKYMEDTLRDFRRGDFATKLVAIEIVKALLSAKSVAGLKKLK